MSRWFQVFVVVALFTGCAEKKATTLGKIFEGTNVSVAVAKRSDRDSPVIVRGTMIEKCPEAGCWFLLRDESGVIKVDTKDAGFVVVEVPLRISITVAGRVTMNGAERIISATGLRY